MAPICPLQYQLQGPLFVFMFYYLSKKTKQECQCLEKEGGKVFEGQKCVSSTQKLPSEVQAYYTKVAFSPAFLKHHYVAVGKAILHHCQGTSGLSHASNPCSYSTCSLQVSGQRLISCLPRRAPKIGRAHV